MRKYCKSIFLRCLQSVCMCRQSNRNIYAFNFFDWAKNDEKRKHQMNARISCFTVPVRNSVYVCKEQQCFASFHTDFSKRLVADGQYVLCLSFSPVQQLLFLLLIRSHSLVDQTLNYQLQTHAIFSKS